MNLLDLTYLFAYLFSPFLGAIGFGWMFYLVVFFQAAINTGISIGCILLSGECLKVDSLSCPVPFASLGDRTSRVHLFLSLSFSLYLNVLRDKLGASFSFFLDDGH